MIRDMAVERWEGMCRSIVSDYWAPGMDNDDLMQEARIGAFKALRDFREDHGTDLAVFVAICVRRQVITAVKTATRVKHGSLNEAIHTVTDEYGNATDVVELLPARDTPPRTVEGRERLHQIGERIRTLSEVECQCLLGILNDDSYEQISVRHGLSFKTIDNAMQRARRKLEEATCATTRFRYACPRCGGPTRKRPGRGRPPRCVVCRVREARKVAA